MRATHSHTGTRGAAALADPVVAPDPELPVPPRRAIVAGTADPAVTSRAVARTHVAALEARIRRLEARLDAAERRHDATVERYERILQRRTERFRSWVEQDDPRPEEFTWIGRSRETAPGPNRTRSAESVATDGGHDRTTGTDRPGPLSRLLGYLRKVIG